MRSRHSALSPLLRSIAAVVLSLWVAALTLCGAHCSLGTNHCGSEQGSCHDSVQADSHHEDGDSSDSSEHDTKASASCLILKSVLPHSEVVSFVQPDLNLLSALASITFAFDVSSIKCASLFLRQARLGEWVFTPEVCLGPAFRSLAPPNSSLT